MKLILCASLPLALVACSHHETPAPDDHPGHDTPTAEAPEAAEAAEAAAADEQKLAKVEVSKEGAKLDPAVKPEQLPAGVWYCDMGTAHWAGMEKPDEGKCPVCGMELKEYMPDEHAAQKKEAVEPHAHPEGEEHGHDHGEGEHEH